MTDRIHTLRDGSRVLVRPIRPDDKQRLVAGFQAMSPQSRYLRFHAPLEKLDDRMLRYLTEIDYRDHMAYVALAVDEPGQPGMGVARYIRLPDEPTVAEIALTVVDAYQGRGLGTLLLGVLTRAARETGVEVFRSYVLAENTAMRGLLDKLGADMAQEARGLYRIDLALPADPDDLPGTPAARALRAVAHGSLPPFCPFHPTSWLRRLEAAQDGPGGGVPASVAEPVGREAPMLREHLDRIETGSTPSTTTGAPATTGTREPRNGGEDEPA